MNIYLVILNIAVLLLFTGILAYMQKKRISFSKQVFAALGIGIVFGLVLQWAYRANSAIVQQSAQWFDSIGTGYVKLLQMIVIPLVFISIVTSFTKLTISNNLGKIATLIIGLLLGTTAIAASIGIAYLGVRKKQPEQAEMFKKNSRCYLRDYYAHSYTSAPLNTLRNFGHHVPDHCDK